MSAFEISGFVGTLDANILHPFYHASNTDAGQYSSALVAAGPMRIRASNASRIRIRGLYVPSGTLVEAFTTTLTTANGLIDLQHQGVTINVLRLNSSTMPDGGHDGNTDFELTSSGEIMDRIAQQTTGAQMSAWAVEPGWVLRVSGFRIETGSVNLAGRAQARIHTRIRDMSRDDFGAWNPVGPMLAVSGSFNADSAEFSLPAMGPGREIKVASDPKGSTNAAGPFAATIFADYREEVGWSETATPS